MEDEARSTGADSVDIESGAIKMGIVAVKDMVLAAMEGAPPAVRFGMLSAGLGSVIAVAFSVGFFSHGDSNQALIALVATMVFVVVVILLFRSILRDTAVAEADEIYSVVFAKLPLPNEVVNNLSDMLESVRKQIFEAARQERTDLEDDQIRANIFLPDYKSARDGFMYRLYMPKRLTKKMNTPAELEARLYPGEGATGTAFDRGAYQVIDSREYMMTDRHRDVIHEDLQWVVSVPLLDSKSRTIGVLNVDGLKHKFDASILEEYARTVRDRVRDIGGVFEPVARVRSVISTKELNA